MKWGVKQALVVSNWEIAKECFTTNDKAFAGRPTYGGRAYGDNFWSYGSRHMALLGVRHVKIVTNLKQLPDRDADPVIKAICLLLFADSNRLWLTGGAISPYGRALFMMLHTSQKLNSAEKWDGLMASRAKINSPSLETMMSAMQKEGYVASRSHIASNAIKTNCPMVVCIRIAKELQGCQKT
ncbi:hypothetical protein CUMW_153080 [Citrus unshiu]|uniref:Uncharacterized protein n=1 Tax=Citrus unshiu TaxID=55188 RepID=A0A2H5PNN2_CITUN|nr:hypothetical protein CUMW_153080 [Citrus unshiu]